MQIPPSGAPAACSWGAPRSPLLRERQPCRTACAAACWVSSTAVSFLVCSFLFALGTDGTSFGTSALRAAPAELPLPPAPTSAGPAEHLAPVAALPPSVAAWSPAERRVAKLSTTKPRDLGCRRSLRNSVQSRSHLIRCQLRRPLSRRTPLAGAGARGPLQGRLKAVTKLHTNKAPRSRTPNFCKKRDSLK